MGVMLRQMPVKASLESGYTGLSPATYLPLFSLFMGVGSFSFIDVRLFS